MDVVKIRKDLRIVKKDFGQEKTLNTSNLQSQPSAEPTVRESVRGISYQEIPGLRHETKDVLKQLQSNIQTLEDLGGRLGFLMSEIRSLIRR